MRNPVNLMGRVRVLPMRAPLTAVMALAASVAGGGCNSTQNYPVRDAGQDVPVEAGSVFIDGGWDNCPVVVAEASPSMVRVGQTVVVSAQATDPEGSALTFSWKAPSGTFADAAAGQTTFTCTDGGPVAVNVGVSDGVCTTTQTLSVFCLGVQDGGAAGTTGSAGSAGSAGATGSGGSGQGGAGGAGATTGNACPAAEPTHGTADCPSCTANCSLGPAGSDGCCGLSNAADQVLCETAVACFAAKKCTTSGDALRCFCGTSGGSCYTVKGAANGPCTAEVYAAAKTMDPAMVKGQFTSGVSALGRAVNLLGCWGSFCSAECDVP